MTPEYENPVTSAIAAVVARYRIRTIPLATLLDAAARVDRTASTQPGWRATVATSIDALAADGIVELPATRWDRTGVPPLPLYVTRPKPDAPTPVTVGSVIWHAELGWAADAVDAGELRPSDRRYLRAVNDWLPRRRATTVPIRERSLEIFGDEKLLERLMTGPLFGPGRLSFDFFACEPVWPPVHQTIFGSGTWLVVENYTTYWSLTRFARDFGFDGRLIWGSGNQAGTRLDALAVAGDRPADPVIRYFGDLDAGGLRVARTAHRRCAELSLGSLAPATPLYELALNHGRPRALKDAPIPTERLLEWTSHWLPDHLARPIRLLAETGQQIVQETVGSSLLNDTCDSFVGLLTADPVRPSDVRGEP